MVDLVTPNQYANGGPFEQLNSASGGITNRLPATAMAPTTISTVGAGVITAAGIVGGAVIRSGSTSAYSDATDTAVAIAAVAGVAVGQSFLFDLNNTTAFAETVTAGVGVTLAGLAGPIPANSTATYLVQVVSGVATTMTCIRQVYNSAGGFDPNTVLTQFGGGTGTFAEEGNIVRQVSGVATGVNPGATAADNVIAVFSIPAATFDQAGRGVQITAAGNFAANGNNKTVKIILNPATAVLGSTVGGGGTTISSSGVVAQNGGAWVMYANLFKRGALGSNTQLAIPGGVILSGSHAGATAACTDVTATESGAILVAITGNAATATTDIILSFFEVNAMN